MIRLSFVAPDDGPPVALLASTGCGPVIDHLLAAAGDWPRCGRDTVSVAPLAEIEPAGPGRWQVRSTLLEGGAALFENPLAAANALVGVLISGLLLTRPDWLCLHAAALDLDGAALVLPGDHQAGKSLFAGVAAALGLGIIADDRVLLRLPAPRGEGPRQRPEVIALGIQPKLRLPLPAALPDRIRVFLDSHAGAPEGEMRFLDLPRGIGAGRLLPFGTRRNLGLLGFPERQAALGHAPRWRTPTAGAATARLIPQLFAPAQDARGRIQAAGLLVAAGGGNVLSYENCWEALPLLRTAMAAPSRPPPDPDTGDADR